VDAVANIGAVGAVVDAVALGMRPPMPHQQACNATPWAIMGISRMRRADGTLEWFQAKGSAGVRGGCPCTGVATPPLGPPPCPGTTVYASGSFPAPQTWTITCTTCLGGAAGCETPNRVATASVFGPPPGW
jgi:hypothetical protein